jgi:epoxide hydrolase-like predicted phosphatase
MTRGLILDFGGVVTTDFYGALAAFCEREGLPPDAILHALRDNPRGQAALAGVEAGEITQRDYELELADVLGVNSQGLLGRALADLRPCEPILALVDQARSAGVVTAVLSNSWGTGEYDPYDGYQLDERFDVVLISDQVGLRKPDPAIYELAAHKLGVPPAGCVFVDDTEHNLPPAQQLGMTGVFFRDPDTGVPAIVAALGLTPRPPHH